MTNSTVAEEMVACGSVSVGAMLLVYLKKLMFSAMGWVLPIVAMVIIDLIYGVKAAKCRGEKVSVSGALRRTITKFISYFCWILMSVGFGMAFNLHWIQPVIMGIAVFIEFISILDNILSSKGKQINSNALLKWIFSKFGNHPLQENIIEDKDKKEGK